MSENYRVHVVKSWKQWFKDVITGARTSDIRRNDRDYAVGDYLSLNEFDPIKREYTGRMCMVEITYIQQNHYNPCAESPHCLTDGFAVLSIKLVKEKENE